jgi:hypothetical protein
VALLQSICGVNQADNLDACTQLRACKLLPASGVPSAADRALQLVLHLQVSQPLVPLVDEFASRLFAELDYMAEGRNAERFQVRRRQQYRACCAAFCTLHLLLCSM